MPAETIATIGNYDVLEKLATSDRGDVFLARARDASSRHVVLERLGTKFSTDEVQLAATLSHPNIAQIYELFEDGENGPVIAREYVPGVTLRTILRAHARRQTGGLPFGIVARITNAICEALHHAYFEAGPDGAPRHVVHRDIRPSNVIVGYDGQIKLVDFGIAPQHEAPHATSPKSNYGYMSPEQIKSQPLDHRADIFSLGTMTWEMLVGKRLFKRDTDMQMLYAILEEDIPAPSDRNDTIPAAVDHVVMRALARSRDDRYQDSLAIAQELGGIASTSEWDIEASTLSRFLRELIPEQRAPALESVEATVAENEGPRAGTVPPKAASTGSGMVIAILVLVLISSVGFWVAIAPNL